jgi:putative heme-binding domain-containing protein
LRDSSAEKQAQIRQWKTTLTSSLTSPYLSEGRALFERHCATCHVLFGTGQKVGPDLTGSQRENLDYLLENILDPSATVSKDFRASVVAMKDGRVFTGLITSRAPKTVTLQTATEKKTLSVDDIEEVRATQQSPMPDGLLQNLSQEQVKNLIAYLRHPHQVALPTP